MCITQYRDYRFGTLSLDKLKSTTVEFLSQKLGTQTNKPQHIPVFLALE